jgi:hypothetical protein
VLITPIQGSLGVSVRIVLRNVASGEAAGSVEGCGALVIPVGGGLEDVGGARGDVEGHAHVRMGGP